MRENSSNRSPWQEPETFLQDNFNAVREGMDRSMKEVTNFAQRNPEKALLWAFGCGYLLRMLPIGEIFQAITRVLFALVKPAALVYGGLKIWQQAQAVVAPSDPNSSDERSGRTG
jgi:hypothetical protein